MRADFNQLHSFIFSKHAPEPIPLCVKVDMSHAHRALVLQDQVFQCVRTVARHTRKLLSRD